MSDTHGLERVTFEDMMREGVKLSNINDALASRDSRKTVVVVAPTGSVFYLNIAREPLYDSEKGVLEGSPEVTIWKTAFARLS